MKLALRRFPVVWLFCLFAVSAHAERQRVPIRSDFPADHPVTAAENEVVKTMFELAGPVEHPDRWRDQIVYELRWQVRSLTPAVPDRQSLMVARLKEINEQVKSVHDYFVRVLGVPRESLNQKIRTAETSFLRIRWEGPHSGTDYRVLVEKLERGEEIYIGAVDMVAILQHRDLLALSHAQVCYLATHNLSAFHLPLVQFVRAVALRKRFLSLADAQTLFVDNMKDFIENANEDEADLIYRFFVKNLKVHHANFLAQTRRQRELGADYLFDYVTVAKLESLVERLLAKGYALDREAVSERARHNLFGFLIGDRILRRFVDKSTGLKTIGTLFTDTEQKGTTLVYSLPAKGWDLPALNTVNTDYLIPNYLKIVEHLGRNRGPNIRYGVSAPYLGKTRMRTLLLDGAENTAQGDRPARGELVLHRLGDIHPIVFAQVFSALQSVLSDRELDEFLFDRLDEKLATVFLLQREWFPEGSPTVRRDAEVQASLRRHFAEVRESVSELVRTVRSELSRFGGVATAGLKDALTKLARKDSIPLNELRTIQRAASRTTDLAQTLKRTELLKALLAISPDRLSDLKKDSYGNVCLAALLGG